MPRGTVKIFKVESGYGFIQPEGVDDGTPDVFIHISTVERAGLSTLKAGQLVEYDIAEGRGRPVAQKFVPCEGARLNVALSTQFYKRVAALRSVSTLDCDRRVFV